MNRRGFLSLLGAAGLAPALPSMGAASASSGISISVYARAVGHARTRAQVTAKGLAYSLKISAAQAEAVMSKLTAKGLIQPIAGAAHAVSHTGEPNMWGLNNKTQPVPQPLQDAISKTTQTVSPETGETEIRTSKMDKFEKLSGIAAPMPLVNIDTDMIIPKMFLKTIKRSGLGANLFDEMRFDREGNEIPDFVLNKPAYREAQILVAGDNFGCGSSREHAPWALADFGIKSVISTSFADIFYNNCFKNGILPIVLPQEAVDVLMKDAEKGANARMEIDLEAQTVTTSDGESFAFEVDAFKKHCLLNGLDDIGLTMEKAASIDSFEADASAARPWV